MICFFRILQKDEHGISVKPGGTLKMFVNLLLPNTFFSDMHQPLPK